MATIFREPTPAGAFAALDVLFLHRLGATSPQSAHAAAHVLDSRPTARARRAPRSSARHGGGGPIKHSREVDAEMARYLDEV